MVAVDFGGFPFEIGFHKARDFESDGKGNYHNMLKAARENETGEAIVVMEFLYHGAYNAFHIGRLLPKELLNGSYASDASREECAKYERHRDLARTPARDGEGKSVSCILDRIDHVLIDARLNFRPPSPAAPGAKRSSTSSTTPKTIFEYVERKVTAMEWDV